MVAQFALTGLDRSAADRLVAEWQRSPLSYAEVGATRGGAGAMPSGYHHDDQELVLGRDGEVFERAKEGLRRWKAHEGAGVGVHPADAPLTPGTTVLVLARIGPIQTRAMCRIVYTVDDEAAFGFAYGTLDLHPVRGEESFVVERRPGGEVVFHISAFSRPRHPLARLGGPVGRRRQRRMTGGYLESLHVFVTEART
ncbi:MAG: DUF1990 family protein [Acidimicrobiales bacterium]